MQKDDVGIIGFNSLREFCEKAYMKAGVPQDEAAVVADLLARADLRGVASHGVTRPAHLHRASGKGLCAQKVSI